MTALERKDMWMRIMCANELNTRDCGEVICDELNDFYFTREKLILGLNYTGNEDDLLLKTRKIQQLENTLADIGIAIFRATIQSAQKDEG